MGGGRCANYLPNDSAAAVERTSGPARPTQAERPADVIDLAQQRPPASTSTKPQPHHPANHALEDTNGVIDLTRRTPMVGGHLRETRGISRGGGNGDSNGNGGM